MTSPESQSENSSSPAKDQETPDASAHAQPCVEGDELQKRVQDLEAQLKEKDSKYLYLYAEFENFKKRAIKERSDLMKYGCESLARELLQVIDNLERALAHMPAVTDKILIDGLHMVINQFRATLQKQGVQTLESVDQSFDPNVHEAIGQEPSEKPAGTVVREELKGYTLHGRLLRPSRVVISAGGESGLRSPTRPDERSAG